MKATALTVILEKNANLTGGISATESRHIDERGQQNTHFTINEYYYLGHMGHRSFYNGGNDVTVILEAGSVWNVTEPGIITDLQIKPGAVLNGRAELDGMSLKIEPNIHYSGIITIYPV